MTYTADMLRPLGYMERFMAARQDLGYHNVVSVTARYKIPHSMSSSSSGSSSLDLIYDALSKVVHQHGLLQATLDDISSIVPQWHRLKSIDLSRVVSIIETGNDEDTARALCAAHRERLSCLPDLPLWRVIVLHQPGNLAHNTSWTICFMFSHILNDGISGATFHRCLLAALNDELSSTTPSVTNGKIVVYNETKIAKALEDAVVMSLGPWFMLKTLFAELIYKPRNHGAWLGAILPDGPPKSPIASRQEYLYLEAEQLERLVSLCRKHQTTVTALLGVLVARQLSKQHPGYDTFPAQFPFNMRKFSNELSDYDMGNYVSSANVDFQVSTNTSEVQIPTGATDAEIWNSAMKARTILVERTSSPANQSVSMLKFVSNDFRGFFRGKLGKARDVAFEISNIGVVDGGLAGDATQASFDRIALASSALYTGPAYFFTAATVKGGVMAICLMYDEDVLDYESEVVVMMQALEKELHRLVES